MIITKLEFLERAKIDPPTLEVWIEEEWLIPRQTAREPIFSEADLARAKLIRDLIDDMGVNAEGVGVVLHLLDQLHGLRKAMAEVLTALHRQSGQSAGPSGTEDQGGR
ncbi:chaperone modulator CbpM [Rhodoblastus sp.]|uniref:chaperone modulator CbpM n=1 Tax=Rhodoblastus sp. TaxID=1962975 RepID=UPI003F9E5DA1